MFSSGQKHVNEDCSRLNPTNAVNHNQLGLCQCAKPRLPSTNVPANIRIYRSKLMLKPVFFLLSYVFSDATKPGTWIFPADANTTCLFELIHHSPGGYTNIAGTNERGWRTPAPLHLIGSSRMDFNNPYRPCPDHAQPEELSSPSPESQ